MKSTPTAQPSQYNPLAITLHWLTVILMFGAVTLAPEEERGGGSSVFPHMIVGGLLAVVLIARLIVRFSAKRPAHATAGNAFFDFIGKLTHFALYLLPFVILAGGASIAYQRNLVGALLGSGAVTHMSRSFIGALHGLGWFLTILLILLHVGAVLYHQFILKDNLMKRMWYGK